jgi:cytochrome c oxidase subunit III
MNIEPLTPAELKAQNNRSQKLLLIVAMVSMIMIFAGLTSAFVVAKSREDWLKNFNLPIAFYWSTAVILVSSLTFHLAKLSIKKDDRKSTTTYLLVTLGLGFLFVFLQFLGFHQLIDLGYFFTGPASNITTTFLFVLAIMHLAHLFGGLIALFVINYKQYKNKYNASEYLGIELGAMFWHFLDALWLYLFFFLMFFK